MSNLAGLHDIEAAAVTPPDTWIVDTIALSENPTPRNYPTSINVIGRLNYGYGSTGTLPEPNGYQDFAARVVNYVSGSRNCQRWIIGNEPNLSREWPNGQPIFPWHYAGCFDLCRKAIRSLSGHNHDEVLIAGTGPWNNQLKYSGNPNGDWVIYFSDVIELLGDDFDGYALHAYTHGYDTGLVTSTARMDAPFGNRYYNFRTYQDYCNAIPADLKHKAAYITEANGDGPWRAVGLIPAMLGEINSWNVGGGLPTIQCVVNFRYPSDKNDGFGMADKGDVMAEYQSAVAMGFSSAPVQPPKPQPPTPQPEPTPPTKPPQPPSGVYVVEWDERLDARGTTLMVGVGGAGGWRVRVGRWYDEQQAQGRVNCYIAVLDEQGNLVSGVPVKWFWGGGGPGETETKETEVKSDPFLGGMYSLDFAMYNVAPSYSFTIADGALSDVIGGLGLGDLKQPDYKIHTCYYFEVQWVVDSGPGPTPEPPDPEPPTPQPPADLRALVWPVQGPITNAFGEGEPVFGQIGHNGIDIAIPLNTPVACVYDGEVVYTGVDKDYGNYVRVYHPAYHFHSFYAHLNTIQCSVGQRIERGATIALSGSTGNSTGPHLHLEFRGGTRDAYYDVSYGYTQGRFDPKAAYLLTGAPLTPGAGR